MSTPGENMESTPVSSSGKRGGGSFMLWLIIVLVVALAGVYWWKNYYLAPDAGWEPRTNLAEPDSK